MLNQPVNLAQMSSDELKEKETHTTSMVALASTLSYSEYKDVEDLETSYEMWEKLKVVCGGDMHVLRAKVERLRGKFDEMKMQEGEEIEANGK